MGHVILPGGCGDMGSLKCQYHWKGFFTFELELGSLSRKWIIAIVWLYKQWYTNKHCIWVLKVHTLLDSQPSLWSDLFALLNRNLSFLCWILATLVKILPRKLVFEKSWYEGCGQVQIPCSHCQTLQGSSWLCLCSQRLDYRGLEEGNLVWWDQN